MEMYIINESSSNKKKYKCPYCEYREERSKLIDHVEEEHENMIPEGYNATRVIFNTINKKEHGTCIQCGSETKWNFETSKYERLCEKKKCYDDYTKMVRERMTNTYGVPTLMNDMEHQKKMLANRAISGEYKFKDGGIRSYCGSYEKKLLEFYDKVLNVHSREIMTPGPTVEYEFNGKKLYWITDVYYITANLVHDAKDGGDNPNNREMAEYRAKQDAKEKSISKLNEYNYIRLTDNNFQQLLYILAEIKENLLDPQNKREYVIHINESLAGVTGGVMPNISDGYVTQFSNGELFNKDGISFSKDLSSIYVIEDDKIKKKKPTQVGECTLFKINKDCGEIKEYIELMCENQTKVDFHSNYFYKLVSGKDVLSSDQICFDEGFIEERNMYYEATIKQDISQNTINEMYKVSNTILPILEISDIVLKDVITEKYSNINIVQDLQGYFAINLSNYNRSGYYENVSSIPDDIIEILNRL